MALNCGFYNSLNHDRKYDARDFGQLFDGIIRDGVFMSIGDCFIATSDGAGMSVLIGTGHAWFNQTWTTNDSPMMLWLDPSEIILKRIDTIVLEVNTNIDVRNNTIKVVKGVPASDPSRPNLVNDGDIHQYPICDIYIESEVESITQANITNRVGTSDTPFVTGILETISADKLLIQWEAEWQEYVQRMLRETAKWTAEQKLLLSEYEKEFEADMNSWMNLTQGNFDQWFQNIQYTMDGDVALNLKNQIDALNQTEFNHYYGMVNKTTNIVKTPEGSTVEIIETSDDGVATTTFEEIDISSKNIITIFETVEGFWNYKKIVTISSGDTGKTVVESYERLGKTR